jgi:cellulose synthase/poly-beta-1,6-N-acetylglucosamine synthase-like glycosyltransferase
MTLGAFEWREFFIPAVRFIDLWVLSMLGIYCLHYLFQMVTAYRELLHVRREASAITPWWLLTGRVTLPISILVPAYNEEKTIVESVRSLLSLHYPDFEVLVVNDGSKDHTMRVLIDAFQLERVQRVYPLSAPCKPIHAVCASRRYPNLTVVDKENGGKSDALNAGLNLSRCPLVCMVDADSMLEPDSLLRMVRPFILEPERMVAVGGKIRIANGCEVRGGQVVKAQIPRTFLPLMQTVEYIRAFQMARLSWSRVQSVVILSGAFCLYKRAPTLQVGGLSHGTVGEDMELTVKLHRHFLENKIPYQVRYLPDPVCWTEAPSTLKILKSQRTRWARGMLEVLHKHRDMIFSPRHGMPGMLGLGYFFLFDAIGPFIELMGFLIIPTCWLAGILNTPFLLSYLGLLFVFGVFVSVGCLFLEEITSKDQSSPRDLLILTLCAVAENFGYRQLNSLWRIRAVYQFFRKKQGWGKMVRTGFQKTPTTKST